MPRKKEKAKSGAAKTYITRTQAVRKLQISLQDFRRLCIFKGIYPREPRDKQKVRKGSTPSTTFYYAKDIQFLLHEPLLNKFRDHKALAKKIGRALGRNEADDAARWERATPKMSLDHLIKERYPTFIDALRDMDDALSMLFLFASLPSTTHVPPKTIALCQRLCLEFQHYLIVSRSLKKSFLSIKGIYYQATIQGQDIMWLVPYKFVQKMAGDIDFRIMGTFIEFYTTLLGFVNYRLYTTVGLVYPPTFSTASDEQGGELGAYTLEGRNITSTSQIENGQSEEIVMSDVTQNQNVETNGAISSTAQLEADKLALVQRTEDDKENQETQANLENEQAQDSIDKFQVATIQDADILAQPQHTDSQVLHMFSDFTIFLSRETPKVALEFIIKAFGCKKVGWHEVLGDGAFTTDESDARITHQIVDRPQFTPIENTSDDSDGSDGSGNESDSEISPQVKAVGALRVPGRVYVQPQWIWDCINQGRLLRPDLYAPGATLPPHLSPWVRARPGAYDPTATLAEQEKDGEAELDEAEAALEKPSAKDDIDDDSDVSAAQSDDSASSLADDDLVVPGEGMKVDMSDEEDEELNNEQDESEGISDQEDVDESDEAQGQDDYQREIEAEASGKNYLSKKGDKRDALMEMRKRKALKEKKEQEELDRQRMMMPNRKRKLFDKMQYGNSKREAEAEKLRKKKRKLERSKGQTAA